MDVTKVPPKFFWTKSRVELFDNRVGNAFGYAVIFFFLPFFVVGVVTLGGNTPTNPILIQHPEHPQRDAVAVAELCFINGQETVGNVGDLVESLPAAAHLEEVFVIYKEVALFRIFDFIFHAELAVEKCFALVAFVHARAKGVHQVGIAHKNLVRLVKVLVAFGLGCEQP